MPWPFRKSEAQFLANRDPQNQKIVLDLREIWGLPFLTIAVCVRSSMNHEEARNLRDQIDALLAHGEKVQLPAQ
jgi:hypothetical protein